MAKPPKKPKDGSDNGRYTEKHKKTVIGELKKDGVILELNTHHKMLENGWISNLNERFSRIERNLSWKERVKEFTKQLSIGVDSASGEIDIVAEKQFRVKRDPFIGSHVSLIIECKTRLDSNWVLLMKENVLHNNQDPDIARLSMNETSIFNYLGAVHKEEFDFWGKEIHRMFGGASHHSNDRLTHIAETGWGLFKNRNSLYNAVRHVLDALDYFILQQCFMTDFELHRIKKRDSQWLSHWRFYPTIVFDGSLWGLKYVDGEIDISPLDHGVLEYTHQNRRYYVDIVRIDALDKFLEIIDQEIKDITKISID